MEGAIPLPALWQLVVKYDGVDQVPSLQALEAKFRYTDFDGFIQTWIWKNGFLRQAEDFTFIAEAVARHLAAQNIRYVEAFYSPPDFARLELTIAEITSAIREGLDRVEGIRIALVADFVRNYGIERASATLDALVDLREHGLIGVGIGGSEAQYPPEDFAEIYDRARAAGFRTSAHAGEAAGAASIWGALRSLRVDRIGHGTRATEDEALVEHLAEKQIPIEMCPISNVRTAVVSDLAEHPIRAFFDRGLLITVNTDDPAMFQTSLAHEYRQLAAVHGFSRSEIRTLIDNAVTSSWLSDDEKSALRGQLSADPGWAIE